MTLYILGGIVVAALAIGGLKLWADALRTIRDEGRRDEGRYPRGERMP